MLAGALGNIVDSLFLGHVVDMIHVVFWGWDYPVFNVADSFIFLGCLGFLWDSFQGKVSMQTSKRLSLIAIGDEILCGHTLNRDASIIALACTKIGRMPLSHAVVGDDLDEIEKVLRRELSLGGDVIAFGGLGPTLDDCTRQVVAKIFQRPLVVIDEYKNSLESRYGKNFPTILDQSTQPAGASLLANSVGTAPGLILEDKKLFPGARLYVLPGPPSELEDVLTTGVISRLEEGKRCHSVWLTFFDILEHDMDPLLRRLKKRWPSLIVGIYPAYGVLSIHLACHGASEVISEAQDELLHQFGKFVLPEGISLQAYCLSLLKERGWKVSTAESCTAGGLAALIASEKGASDVFFGGVVAYRESIKQKVLNVPEGIIERYGVVSEEVTAYMAQSVKVLMGTDVAIATSGYFGPAGGTSQAPVGTVCATFLIPGKTCSQTFLFHGTRTAIREQALGCILARFVRLLLDSQ